MLYSPAAERWALDGTHASMTISFAKPCIYCGGDADTRDHVPPKSFFPVPRPSDLITVPSCTACNRGFQLDDDYAQTVLVMREDVGDHPAVTQLLPKLMRSWERSQGKGLPRSIVATTRTVPIHTPAGVFLGNAPAYGVSGARMQRFIERIVRALFFSELGYALPAGYALVVILFAEAGSVLTDMQRLLSLKTVHSIGGGVFAYCWASAAEDLNATAWLLTFYDRIAFTALTAASSKRRSRAV